MVILPLFWRTFLIMSEYVFKKIFIDLEEEELLIISDFSKLQTPYKNLFKLNPHELYTLTYFYKDPQNSYEQYQDFLALRDKLLINSTNALIIIKKLQMQMLHDDFFKPWLQFTQYAYLYCWLIIVLTYVFN